MSTKYLILIFLILFAVQGAQIGAIDSQEFKQPAFSSEVKISGVAIKENITVSMQWTLETLPQTLNIYLYLATEVNKGTPLTCSATPSSCTVIFNGVDYTATSGDYFVYIQYSAAYDPTTDSIAIASLTVNGDAPTRSTPTIVKQLISLGNYRFHRIYTASTGDVTVTTPYDDSSQSTTILANVGATGGFVSIYPESTGTYSLGVIGSITLTATAVPDSSSNPTGPGKITWVFSAVPAGFNWIIVDVSNIQAWPPTWDTYSTYFYRLNYMTEPYDCPYNSDYPDTKGIFRGCSFPSQASKLPCVLYNTTINACQVCYIGYNLVNGVCLEAACPAGQYKRYGQCLKNPEGCQTFNSFTNCTKCSTGYNLEKGVCSKAPLNCTDRTFFNSATFTCDKVDDKCLTWDVKGLCLTCVNATDKVSNGKCVPIESLCTDKQFVNAKGECVDADPLCSNFEKFGGRCIKCVWGYQYNATQAKCVKIICPSRYVPNDFGKCAKVSDLCDVYDAHGVCLGCIPSHVLQDNGVCLQAEKPNPCPARQYLGDDNLCHEVDVKCEIYNKDGGKCTKCINNFYLMYTGECVLQVQCKSRQVNINNECHDVSPTCGNYDRTTGKCLNCVSDSYELYYGLCIPVSKCGVRQWTDNNKQCHDVDNRCNTFNPSTGECTSCVQGYNFLNGICCIRGQYNNNGQCVDSASASQIQNSDGCVTYVNGIGCVRCSDGFERAQDEFGFYYCKSV